MALTATRLQAYSQTSDRRASDSDEDGLTAGAAFDPALATRDEFNLHKVIITMTAAGKVGFLQII